MQTPNGMKRRDTLKALGGLGTGLGLGWSLPGLVLAQADDPFPNPLQIPSLLDGERADDATHYRLTVQAGQSHFLPGLETATWGYSQPFLGPTLRLRVGELAHMHVHNTLPESTTVHWHGLHIPARADGGPKQVIEPGATWEPMFYVRQRAGTFWYHSHKLDETGPQVYQGLAGMLLIEDAASSHPDLPAEYGVDDIPVIVQDRNFTSDGQFRYISTYDDIVTGIQGDTLLVNGTWRPHFIATTGRLRLRLLNAANARTFFFAFSDDRPFLQVASDGGLLETPVELQQLDLAPAERADIIVDVSDGRPVTLISHARVSGFQEYPGAMSDIMRSMNTQGFEILAIRPDANLRTSPVVPQRLTEIPRLDASLAVRTRRFTLTMGNGPRSGGDRGPGLGRRNGFGGGFGGGNYSINGRQMDINHIGERVPLNDIEIWEIYNSSVMTHPFHIHDVQFRILDRDGTPPAPNEMGLKDTVKVHPLQTVRVLLQFTDYADADNPYMYHCHMLEHEDRGMMGMFLVV